MQRTSDGRLFILVVEAGEGGLNWGVHGCRPEHARFGMRAKYLQWLAAIAATVARCSFCSPCQPNSAIRPCGALAAMYKAHGFPGRSTTLQSDRKT